MRNKVFSTWIILCIVLVTLALLAVTTTTLALPTRASEAGPPAQQALGPSSQVDLGAPAATHTVNSNGDASDANPGDGVCLTTGGTCTLRAAIEETNALTGADTINFDSSIITVMPQSALPALDDPTGGTTIKGNPTGIWGIFAGNADGLGLVSDDNKLQGLLITNFDGNGVRVEGNNNIIGTDGDGVDDATEGNVIGTNDDYGVSIYNNATGNWVAGNLIGLTPDGTGDAGNVKSGVVIFGGASANRVGANGDGVSDELERNVISGNDEYGVYLANEGTDDNVVAGNYIGTNAAGDAAIPNTLSGVFVTYNSDNNIIGTDGDGVLDEVEGNLISGNGEYGVSLDSYSSGNVIAGNYIGTNAAGDAAVPNDRGVVIADAATNNRVGTNADGVSDELERNVISGNEGCGVGIYGQDTTINVVAGNYIGANAAGDAAVPNDWGVSISDCSGNYIGGTLAAERNVISGNSGYGIRLAAATLNLVQGNYIGTDASGAGNLGNLEHGVYLDDSYHGDGSVDNTIGGMASGEVNRIAFNGQAGIYVEEICYDNELRGNIIFSNGGLGIDLFPGEDVTPNDVGDGDEGGNHLQNFPVLSSVTSDVSQTYVEGTFNSISNTAFVLDFFANSSCDPMNYGEGETYLGSETVGTDGSGDASLTATFGVGIPGGHFVTAIATDPDGNTSEFSRCRIVIALCDPAHDADFDWVPTTPAIGQQVTFDGEAGGTLPITFTWSFGDTTVGAGATVTHTYNATGDYPIVVTAINQCGQDTASHTLTVVSLPSEYRVFLPGALKNCTGQ